jgi:hypothetical protein
MNNQEIDQVTLQAALKCLNSQRECQKRYRQSHKDKVNQIALRSYHKMKEDPEKYKDYLEKANERQKKYYHQRKLKEKETN